MSVFTGRSVELVWIVVAACMLCSGLVTGDHVEGHTGSDNSSDGSTTAPQTTATTTVTVTTRAVVLDAGMQDDQCYSDALIQNFCEAPPGLHDLSMWDLYSIMFTETVLNALVISCPKGQWCIQDRFDYWEALIMERVDMVMNSDIAVAMCGPNADPCIEAALDNYLNCSTVYEKLKFTTLSVKLMCHLKQNPDLTTECYKHTLTALHVTLADIMREQTGDINDVSGELCTSPSFHMTRALICITNDCPGETAGFEQFKPWAWFYYVVDDLINRCDLDPNKCTALLTSTAQLVYQNEMRTMMGVSVVTMVSAMVLVTAMCFCYRRHRRNVVLKEGYEKLLNEGDES